MPMLKFHELMLPILEELSDKKTYKLDQLVDKMVKRFNLTDEEQKETVSNGNSRIYDRMQWAKTYLKNGGLAEYPKRGLLKITNKGLKVLELNLESLTPDKIIELFPEVMETKFYNPDLRDSKKDESLEIEKIETPNELIEQGIQSIKDEVKNNILQEVENLSPRQFEILVLKLLVAMGYGTEEFSRSTSYTNDGGIDGVAQVDELGFDRVYIQAKKYSSNVGRPDIQKFVGAMPGTTKGVFITTSDFTSGVKEYLMSRPENIQLINGEKLVDLMYEYNQGSSVQKTIIIKNFDSDYFVDM